MYITKILIAFLVAISLTPSVASAARIMITTNNHQDLDNAILWYSLAHCSRWPGVDQGNNNAYRVLAPVGPQAQALAAPNGVEALEEGENICITDHGNRVSIAGRNAQVIFNLLTAMYPDNQLMNKHIYLESCSAGGGDNSFAQQLQNLFQNNQVDGVRVTAPSNASIANRNGNGLNLRRVLTDAAQNVHIQQIIALQNAEAGNAGLDATLYNNIQADFDINTIEGINDIANAYYQRQEVIDFYRIFLEGLGNFGYLQEEGEGMRTFPEAGN